MIDNIGELTKSTVVWMRKVGAIHDHEKKTRSYITSSDWTSEFEIEYDVDASDIGKVIQHAHSKGEWIAFEPFKGWFLSDSPQDAATVVTRLINYMTSLSRTVGKYLEAQEHSGQMKEIADGYKGRLRIGDIDEITPLLDATGVRLSSNVKVALIEASTKE